MSWWRHLRVMESRGSWAPQSMWKACLWKTGICWKELSKMIFKKFWHVSDKIQFTLMVIFFQRFHPSIPNNRSKRSDSLIRVGRGSWGLNGLLQSWPVFEFSRYLNLCEVNSVCHRKFFGLILNVLKVFTSTYFSIKLWVRLMFQEEELVFSYNLWSPAGRVHPVQEQGLTVLSSMTTLGKRIIPVGMGACLAVELFLPMG